jgi:hypothetical protein
MMVRSIAVTVLCTLAGCGDMPDEPGNSDDPQTSDTTVLIVPANDDSSSGQTDPNDNSEPDPADQDNDDKVPGHRIILVDRTGKEWDITHAVKRYGMEPRRFNFGLGPFAIRPLLNPVMLDPGVTSYPPDDETFPVIGSKTDNAARAYPIARLARVEVVNDIFAQGPVAVGY